MPSQRPLVARAFRLEYATLGWNVLGVPILGIAAIAAGSTALIGFAADTLLEIAASSLVIWELNDPADTRRPCALRIMRALFAVLAIYLAAQSAYTLATSHHPDTSPVGIAWTALTAAVMLTLARQKQRVGHALRNPVVIAEGRVTTIDAALATAVLLGLLLDTVAGAWWADPLAGLVIAFYAAREARHAK